MASFSRPGLSFVAAIALPFGLYGWLQVAATGLGHDGVIGPRANALGTDWMIYFAAARAAVGGDPALIYDGTRLTQAVNAEFADRLSSPLPYHAFLYPPHALLLLVPFALLPFALSYAAGQLLSFAALAAALRGTVGAVSERGLVLLSLLLCPAASNNVISGQNGFLTSALLVGGAGQLARRPVLGGALLGVLTYKPQCWLMVPVALVAARQWRALAAAAASALLLVGASAALLGPGLWQDWLGLLLAPPTDVSETWRDWGRLWDDSVYTCAVLLGASAAVANAAQVATALAAAALVYLAWRRSLASELRLAVLLAATAVAAPHVSNYDLVLLAIAATILALNGLAARVRPLVLLLPLAAWLAPLFNPPRNAPVGLLTPVLIFALIAYAITRAGDGRAIRDGMPS